MLCTVAYAKGQSAGSSNEKLHPCIVNASEETAADSIAQQAAVTRNIAVQ